MTETSSLPHSRPTIPSSSSSRGSRSPCTRHRHRNTTYGALTLGVTWKPELPAPISGLAIRPEIRWDHAFTGNRPFNAQQDNNSFTFGADAVLTF